MLIIPAENAINWKRPPLVTLGLIMACLLVFLFYQGDDSRKLEQAVEQYLAADLHELEAPAYEDYLQRQSSSRVKKAGYTNYSSFSSSGKRTKPSGWPSI